MLTNANECTPTSSAWPAKKSYPRTIALVRNLKARYGLRIAVVSNGSRKVNAHRIRKFKLDGLVDTFISSCFVHARKPDVEKFRPALEIARAPACNVLCIENTPMFVQVAEGLGISEHTSHGLQVCLRKTRFVRIAERQKSEQ
jgi:putative hydrolase of the HAD superfamily